MAAKWSTTQWENMTNLEQAKYYHNNGMSMNLSTPTGGEVRGTPRNMPLAKAYHAFADNPTDQTAKATYERLAAADAGGAGTATDSAIANFKLPAGGLKLNTYYDKNSIESGHTLAGEIAAFKAAGYGVEAKGNGYIITSLPKATGGTSTDGSIGADVSSPPILGRDLIGRIDNYAGKIENISNSQLSLADKMAKMATERNNFEMELAKTQEGRAANLWQRWKTVYEPLETQFVKESQAGTPLDLAAQRAGAGVTQKFNQLGQEQETGLRSAGYSPTDPTWQRAARLRDIAMTSGEAGAMNQARDTTRTENWAKKQYAVGLGTPYQSAATGATTSAGGMTTGGLSGLNAVGQTQGTAAGELATTAGLYSTPYGNMMDWYKLLAQGQFNVQAAKEGNKTTALDWLKWALPA